MGTIEHITDPHFLGGLCVLLGILGGLYFIIRAKENDLECWQFIASRGPDGKQYADIDKLGKVVGIVAGTYVVVFNKPDATTLLIYLSYVGAVAGWSSYLRSKNGPTTTDSGQQLPPSGTKAEGEAKDGRYQG